jgi:enoyl-[acyl-carrier protein] reductase/trans-2-enoyl-CoA reductase (NAD+)
VGHFFRGLFSLCAGCSITDDFPNHKTHRLKPAPLRYYLSIMPLQIIKRRSRGFICVNAHPAGCRSNVERWVAGVRGKIPAGQNEPKNVLIIGASTGYGLASRIASAWGYGAKTLGVFFERPPESDKTATAGHYNTVALHSIAKRDGLFVASINGDAFSDEIKRAAVETIRKEMAPIDLVIYSLASPKRTDPRTGKVHSSVLKPVGQPYTNRTIELDSEKVVSVTLQPANEEEVADTVAVMGGEDWRRWMDMLLEEKLLAPGARTLAYSYIGPEITWPIYRDGTIGQAKKDLERVAKNLDATLANQVGGNAWVSVNKAVVTQASAAIPVVPLYLSLLPLAMRKNNLDEGPLEQMRRLFTDFLCTGQAPKLDEARRLRLDDREMRGDVQAEVAALWPRVTTENLREVSAFAGFQREFRSLFGFEVVGVDYEQPVETDLKW